MRRTLLSFSQDENRGSLPLPGLRPGVVMVGEGDDAELRDLQLGQVVKLGAVASVVVSLLDSTRDAEALLADAADALGEELNPLGLVELLQALDRRALLDTPRARMIVSQGLVRADIAALQRLARRPRVADDFEAPRDDDRSDVVMAPGSKWQCNSCVRCCREQHLLGTITRAERDTILQGFAERGNARGADASNFVPLPSADGETQFMLRPRDGACTFLDEDDKCSIHKVLGEEAKPATCRLFPFRAVQTPSGWHVGLSMNCPTAASGVGPDAKEEAARVVTALPILHPNVRRAPARVRVAEDEAIDWARYEAWEAKTRELLCDQDTDPVTAWLASVRDFAKMAADAVAEVLSLDPDATADDEDGPTRPMPLLGDDELELEVPSGDEVADQLLKELALWSELLVGLEASDPGALRRLRSGLLRRRHALGFRADAAPVLAEVARLDNRRAAMEGEDVGELELSDAELDGEATDANPLPQHAEPQPGDVELQRRFLVQALTDKRAFEFGTVSRGLVALSLYVGILRLPEVPGDEMQPTYRDIAYLLTHPQLTDIIDTRAIVRSTQVDPGVHAALVGASRAP